MREADDAELGRKVAIKVLRPGTSEASEERLRREAQAMAKLRHPNVVTVYDVGVHDGRVFLAMELVDGKSLRDWLDEERRDVGEIVTTLAAAGRGLAAAHDAGLVHRDFKADNVLVGRDGRVQVTDFGLARATDSDEDSAIAGTPAYMAPEQLTGGVVEPRSDQFSFCVTLYEALYGERPFQSSNLRELREAVTAGKVRPAPARARVSASLRAIVARGLAARPGDRFASMDHLLAALGRDRTRLPRWIAAVTAALALAAGVGLFADWIARERAMTVARASFRASSVQADRSLALRSESFVSMAELSFGASVMRDVTSNRDEADFGLGGARDDADVLDELHETLLSADWVMWARETSRSVIAIADYKGRLLYTSDAPTRWGGDVLRLDAARRAFRGQGDGAEVIRADDPALVATGITGGPDDPRLLVVFARVHALGREPRAVFVQVVDAERLLEDVSLADGTLLAIVAPDGASAGEMPRAVIDAGLRAGHDDDEVAIGDHTWLVKSRPLPGLTADTEIARLVLARPVDVGLAGLFPGARGVLGVLTLGLVLACATSVLLARRSRS